MSRSLEDASSGLPHPRERGEFWSPFADPAEAPAERFARALGAAKVRFERNKLRLDERSRARIARVGERRDADHRARARAAFHALERLDLAAAEESDPRRAALRRGRAEALAKIRPPIDAERVLLAIDGIVNDRAPVAVRRRRLDRLRRDLGLPWSTRGPLARLWAWLGRRAGDPDEGFAALFLAPLARVYADHVTTLTDLLATPGSPVAPIAAALSEAHHALEAMSMAPPRW